MRLNKFLALHGNLSRRSADKAIGEGRVAVDGHPATIGQTVNDDSTVTLNGKKIIPKVQTRTIMLNKPVGYVCSKNGQGSKTIYDLLPEKFHNLKPVGRLDKDSSGLLLLTNDGQLANQLTHPRYKKTKVYQVHLDRSLAKEDFEELNSGVELSDGLSKLDVRIMKHETRSKDKKKEILDSKFVIHASAYEVRLAEGRNRQIRRTFAALGVQVQSLNRIKFGFYKVNSLPSGKYRQV